MSAAPPYLRLAGIRKDFGHFRALKGIDLDVARGELLCFLGPSGCGKTTLLRIIAGLEAQTAGSIVLDGRDISTLAPAERDYGIVFQSYALFPNLNVADNVAYGLVNRRVGRAQIRSRVAELLDLVGLPGCQAQYPAQLSGGQQQRIALARALATEPSLLLLDEPLSALDATVRVKLRAEIRSLQRQLGVTTILVTHDQEEAFAVADRIVVMNHGVIEQVGSANEVYRHPATPFVADFVGRTNALPATVMAGGLRLGDTLLAFAPGQLNGHAVGSAVRVFFRPEDVQVLVDGAPDAGPADASDTHRVQAQLDKIDFMGAYALLQVHCPALGPQRLTVVQPLSAAMQVATEPGSRLALRLWPDRMRVFG